jgi:hypothetical protein
MGTVTVGSTFSNPPTTVSFATSFQVPPAVFLLTTASGGDPCAMRLFDVTTSSFDVACVEPETNDGPHAAQTVTFVAVTPGVCSIEGHDFEVVCPDVGALQHGAGVPGAESWDTVGFQTSFASPPMVLAEIQSDNSGGLATAPSAPPCPWLTVAAQQLSAASIDLALERSEVDDGCEASVTAERLCYLAAEAGSITFEQDGGDPGDPSDDVTCEFQSSVGAIRGWDNGCTSVPVSAGTAPIITGFKVTHNGGDGGWLRTCGSTSTSIDLTVDEDVFRDAERSHAAESASVMACSSSFEVTATTDVTIIDVRGVLDENGVRRIEWETMQERGTVGFVLLEEQAGTLVPAHEGVVRAAFDSLHGAVYDAPLLSSSSSQRYWLREISVDGTADHGPFVVDSFEPRMEVAESTGSTVVRKSGIDAGDALAVDDAVGALVHTTSVQRVSLDALASAFGVSPSDFSGWVARGSVCASRENATSIREVDGAGVFYGSAGDSAIVGGRMHRIEHGDACATGSPSIPNDPVGAPLVSEFEVRVHQEQNLVPLTAASARTVDANDDDFWYWAPLFGSRDPEDDVVIDVPPPVRNAIGTVRFEPLLRGVSEATHRVEVWLGASLVGTLEGVGFDEIWGTFEVDAELFTTEPSIRFVLLPDEGSATSVGFVDSIDWRFSSTSPPQSIHGAQATFVPASDGAVSVPAREEGILTEVTEAPVPLEPIQIGEEHFAAVSSSGIYRIDPIAAASSPTLVTPTGSPPADEAAYWVIAPEAWRDSIARLVEYRQSQGLSSRFASLESIFAEHAGGDRDPRAVRAFLRERWQHDTQKPRYIVIAGGGHIDHHDRMSFGSPIVPPLLVGTADGIFASDTGWGDVDADSVPEISIGRLPVHDAAELEAVLDKIVGYDEQPPQPGGALLLSDNRDRAGDFAEQTRRIDDLIEVGATIADLSLEHVSVEDARMELADHWAAHPSLVNYVGHGGLDRFADEGLLRTEDVETLPASERPPFVSALTCWINRFEVPGLTGLGQALALAENGGAVAVWGSGATSTDAQAHLLNRFFLEASAAPGTRIGDAILEAQRRFAEVVPDGGMPATYHLLGDPATKLSLPIVEPPSTAGPESPGPSVPGSESIPGRGCAAQPVDERSAAATLAWLFCLMMWAGFRRVS